MMDHSPIGKYVKMDRKAIVETIQNEKLVFVTRLKDSKSIQKVIGALVDGGAKVMEITSNTPNYAEAISTARKMFKDVLIGAGTITSEALAMEAINAGAQFLVSPNSNLRLVDVAHQHDVPILMGALTPTEVYSAWEGGADFVKLFPADIMGIPYFKSIKAPLNAVKLLAVGGIALEDVKDWMLAGAEGIGIASVLKEPVATSEDIEAIKQNAIQFIEALK